MKNIRNSKNKSLSATGANVCNEIFIAVFFFDNIIVYTNLRIQAAKTYRTQLFFLAYPPPPSAQFTAIFTESHLKPGETLVFCLDCEQYLSVIYVGTLDTHIHV